MAAGAREYRRRVRRAFPFRLWAAGLAAALGGGLLLGIPSPVVPDPVEPAVGVGLLAVALRSAWRRARRTDP